MELRPLPHEIPVQRICSTFAAPQSVSSVVRMLWFRADASEAHRGTTTTAKICGVSAAVPLWIRELDMVEAAGIEPAAAKSVQRA